MTNYRVDISKVRLFENREDEAKTVNDCVKLGFKTETKFIATTRNSYNSYVNISKSIDFSNKKVMEKARKEYRLDGFYTKLTALKN